MILFIDYMIAFIFKILIEFSRETGRVLTGHLKHDWVVAILMLFHWLWLSSEIKSLKKEKFLSYKKLTSNCLLVEHDL